MNTNSFFSSLSVTLLLIFMSGSAIAQVAPPPFQSFDDSDLDGDGYISLEEAYDYHARVFAALDENQDGKLSKTEFVSNRLGPEVLGFGGPILFDYKEQWFIDWDVNGDGELSQAEFLHGLFGYFVNADKDGNSMLDRSEFESRIE